MKQQLLPGMENLFPDDLEQSEKDAFHNLLLSYLEAQAIIRTYPDQLRRAGTVGKKIEQLMLDVESLLSTQFRRE